jgi:hypothetical protein
MKILILLVAITLPACGPKPIYQVKNEPGGVPFFPPITVEKMISQYSQRWTRFDITAQIAIPLSSGKESVWKEATRTVTLFSCDSKKQAPSGAPALQQLLGNLLSARTPGELHAGLAAFSDRLCDSEPTQWATLDQVKKGVLVGVQRGYDQIADRNPKYLEIWAPLGGSANGTLKLDKQGNLVELTAQVQDQLPQTLATTVGGVASAAVTGMATIAAADILKAAPRGTDRTQAQGSDQPKVLGVSVQTSTNGRLYTVSTMWDANKSINPCNTLSDLNAPPQDCLVTYTVSNEIPAVSADKPSTK